MIMAQVTTLMGGSTAASDQRRRAGRGSQDAAHEHAPRRRLPDRLTASARSTPTSKRIATAVSDAPRRGATFIVLPEAAVTGYAFASLSEVLPVARKAETVAETMLAGLAELATGPPSSADRWRPTATRSSMSRWCCCLTGGECAIGRCTSPSWGSTATRPWSGRASRDRDRWLPLRRPDLLRPALPGRRRASRAGGRRHHRYPPTAGRRAVPPDPARPRARPRTTASSWPATAGTERGTIFMGRFGPVRSRWPASGGRLRHGAGAADRRHRSGGGACHVRPAPARRARGHHRRSTAGPVP